jgi:hypothetical protein
MHARRLFSAAASAALLGLLTACGSYVQATSGSRYLKGYAESNAAVVKELGTAPPLYAGPAWVVDKEVAEAARVEPQLRFPARLGLARIDRGGLTPIPASEAKAWRSLAARLGHGYGEFVPISPLISALAAPDERVVVGHDGSWHYRTSLAETVRRIRLGAARQHVDAVLIYEAFARSSEEGNALSVTKIALIGFFLPTEDVEAEGSAQAVLVDVRNGYTYGIASAVSAEPARRLSTSGNSYKVQEDARAEAQARAVEALTGEVETLVRDLRLALAEQRAAPPAGSQ